MRYGPALGVMIAGGLALGAVTGPAVAAGSSVTISNLAYNPATVVVQPGDSVTWTNNDQVSHSVTADDGSFDSAGALCSSSINLGCLRPGQSYSHTFASSGTFGYHCRVHASMHGTVVVAANSVTAPGTTVRVIASTIPSTTSTTAASGLGATTVAGATSTSSGAIGQDVPATTAAGAALKNTSGKTSSKVPTIAVLIGCIALAAAGIGAVVYRIRMDRRLGP